MIFDVRTIGLMSAIMPFVLGFIMIVYWRERKTYGGFGHWITANFAFGMGYLLISLQAVIPDFFSIILGNLAIIYAEILIYRGIQLFYGRPIFNGLNFVVIVLFILLQFYFANVDPNVNARIALVSVLLFILILRLGISLVNGPFPGLHRTAQHAGQVFFITAVLPLTRSVYALSRSQPIDLFSDALSPWFAMLALISILIWTFYFFLLNSARLELDLESARLELVQIANTDALTGLYNRRHFFEHADIELQRARRYGYGVSFLLLDVDDFRLINDSYGHSGGDKVMITLANIFRGEIRIVDLVARFSGDEFVIMLANADEDDAYVAAQRIRKLVEQTPIDIDANTLNIRLSVGIASFEAGDLDLEIILKRADTALYHAKRQGRKPVQVA